MDTNVKMIYKSNGHCVCNKLAYSTDKHACIPDLDVRNALEVSKCSRRAQAIPMFVL